MKRLNCDFWDRLLTLLWLSLVGIMFTSVILSVMPDTVRGFNMLMGHPIMWQITVSAFMLWTAWRLLWNYDMSVTILPSAYIVLQIGYASFWTLGFMPKPINILYAPFIPACVLAMVCVPAADVWKRIKPRNKRNAIILEAQKARQ
jgi:hypothetical protein